MERIYKKILRFIKKNMVAASAVLVLILAFIIVISVYSAAPSDFPRNAIVRIDKDMTVSAAASMLKERGIIKSSYFFKVYVVLLHDGKGVQAGSYLFDQPQSALRVAYRTAYGMKGIEKIKFTVTEGMNSKEIAALLKKSVPGFDSEKFAKKAVESEGYLFPETYFLDPDVTPGEIIDMMESQFRLATKDLLSTASSTASLEDIIIMASIIEEEANNMSDRQVISGILWKRIEEGMPLQVDAPFYYLFGKGSSQLTRADLSSSSPYNTYTNKGLPPAPISNPGLGAIKAALIPKETPYYFYLADRQGVTHYAVTHDGHVVNKQKYLQ